MLILKHIKLIFLFSLFAAYLSCSNTPIPDENKGSSNPKESLLKVNKKLTKTEDQRIDDFISRYKWKMTKTGTGLRFMIYENGIGPKAEVNKIARIEYTVSLLSGEVCYSSAELGLKDFLIGKGGVESGLEEGILFLKSGDRAKIIIPSHLAFGLPGDGNKIPAKATLIYDVKLIELL